MTRGFNDWTAAVRLQPDWCRMQILEAYWAEGGNATHAAAKLGLSHRSLLNYVHRLKLQPAIEELRAELKAGRGSRGLGGAPPGSPPAAP